MAYCEESVELISAALDGALSPEEMARLNAHLSSCPACQALYDDLSALHASFGDLSRENAAPPEDLTERIVSAVAADNVTPLPAGKTNAFHWKRWAACAAALAVVLLGAGRLDRGRSGSAGAAPAQAAVNGEAQYKSAVTADQAAPAEAPAAGEPQAEAAPVAPAGEDSGAAEAVQEAPAEAETAVSGGGAPSAMLDGGAEKNASLSAAPAEAETVPANALPDENGAFTGSFGGVQSTRGTVEQPPAPSEVPAPQEPESREETAEQAPLTPAEALDRLLAEKGFTGWEARGDIGVTWPREGETQDHLVYDALSENGKYYLFVSYRSVYDAPDADTPGHNSRNGCYAVPLDGGDILEETGPEFWEKMAR